MAVHRPARSRGSRGGSITRPRRIVHKPLPKTPARMQQHLKPFRGAAKAAVSLGHMCEAQRVDYRAACRRLITWAQYHAKWGNH